MRRVTKLLIAFTLLALVLLLALSAIFFPQAKEDELKTTTVTLDTYRYEVVGHTPTKHSKPIKAMIFRVSNGQQYQIAMFYKDEAETLSGHTVTIRYVEDGSSYVGAHMIVEMNEGEQVHYTLEEWNQFQRQRVWIMPLVIFALPLVTLCYVLEDLFGIFGRAKRRLRSARKRNARREQLTELQNRPRNFPNTLWQTEDGTLILTVAPDGGVTGTIRVNDGDTVKTVPILFDDTAHTTIRMAELRGGKKRAPYIEIWEADYDSPDEFTAKPQKTTYFRKEKTVTVHRTDDERL